MHGAEVGVGVAEVAEAGALALLVAYLAGNDKPLLVVPNGLLNLAQIRVGEAEAAQGVALALPVADLAGDD